MEKRDYIKTSTHLYFWNSIYSQWFTSKKQIFENGNYFNNAEKYMMYHKALVFNDTEIAKEILNSYDPKTIKALGRKVKNFNDEVWNQHREKIVTQGNYLKFTQNYEFLQELLKDRDLILVEGSPFDKIWGVGLHYNSEEIKNEKNWNGLNLLGKCIMNARDIILKELNIKSEAN